MSIVVNADSGDSGTLGFWELSLTNSVRTFCWLPQSPAFGPGVLEEEVSTVAIHLLDTPGLTSGQPPLHIWVCWVNLDLALQLSAQGGDLSCSRGCLWIACLTSKGGFS